MHTRVVSTIFRSIKINLNILLTASNSLTDMKSLRTKSVYLKGSIHINAFCTCSLFSAWSHTTDALPSITSEVTSRPLEAGRQCIKMQSCFAELNRLELTWYLGKNISSLCCLSSSFPIDTNVSVANTSAFWTAFKGSSVIDISVEPLEASCHSTFRTFSFDSKQVGQAIERFMPIFEQPSTRSLQTLLPSPIHATFNPLNVFFFS